MTAAVQDCQASTGIAGRFDLVDFGRMHTPVFIGIVQTDPSPLSLRSIEDSQRDVRSLASRGSTT